MASKNRLLPEQNPGYDVEKTPRPLMVNDVNKNDVLAWHVTANVTFILTNNNLPHIYKKPRW